MDIDLNFDGPGLRIEENLLFLVDHVTRWRSLYIVALKPKKRLGPFTKALRSLVDLRAPQLKSIYVGVGSIQPVGEDIDIDPPGRAITIFGGGAPILASVQVKGVNLHHCCPPLQKVTLLELLDLRYAPGGVVDHIDYRTLRHWLSVMPSLRHLTINANYGDRRYSIEPIELPSLQSLKLILLPNESCYFGPLLQLCTNIITPSLKSLTFSAFASDEMSKFAKMLRRSSP